MADPLGDLRNALAYDLGVPKSGLPVDGVRALDWQRADAVISRLFTPGARDALRLILASTDR